MLVLGLDIGTTGIKSVVYNESGEIMGTGFRECSVLCPTANHYEQDAEAVWDVAQDVIRISTSKCKNRVSALSVSVQGDAIIAIDMHRNAIAPAQLGIDYRGREEALLCKDRFGGYELFCRTGMRPHPMNSFVKMLHLKHEQPDVFRRAHKLVTFSDYILGKLGSESFVIDYSMASRTMCMNSAKLQWDQEILSKFHFDNDKLSIPVASGTVVGTVSHSLAQSLGLSDKCLIVAGGHDQACAALGAGLEPGIALDSHGTAEVISTVFHQPNISEMMYRSYFPSSAYIIDGMYYTFALLHVGGILLKWFVEGFCEPDIETAKEMGISPYAFMDSKIPNEPSQLFVIPYFNGSGTPTCNLDARGAIIGLTLSNDRYDIARAVMEALSFEAKYNIYTMNCCGLPLHEVRCVGGAARSSVNLQIKADIWDLPVATMKNRESACLGAAMMAAVGAGLFKDFSEATKALVRVGRLFEPDPSKSTIYADRYAQYQEWAQVFLKKYGEVM